MHIPPITFYVVLFAVTAITGFADERWWARSWASTILTLGMLVTAVIVVPMELRGWPWR